MSDDVKESKTSSSSLRNIFALGFVSFFTDVSTEMVLSLEILIMLMMSHAHCLWPEN